MPHHRLLIIYDIEGWAYYHNARALQKYAPDDFEVLVSTTYKQLLQAKDFDLILFLPFTHLGGLSAFCDEVDVHPIIVSVYSVGWGYANEWLEDTRALSDGVIITSYRMWDKAGRLGDTWYLPSGVDLDIFRVTTPIEDRQPRLLWCGSTFHRKIKGYDDIILPLKEKLQLSGLDLDLRLADSMGKAKYSLAQMAEWYNTGTIYACASLAEGTPNPALEAAACGCTIVTTPVGNMPELIRHGWNGYLVKWDVESFIQHICMALDRKSTLAQNMLLAIQEWGWEHRAKGYYDLFRLLIRQ
jgi:glycosyltransferase involved in cell wall biosynthesis